MRWIHNDGLGLDSASRCLVYKGLPSGMIPTLITLLIRPMFLLLPAISFFVFLCPVALSLKLNKVFQSMAPSKF